MHMINTIQISGVVVSEIQMRRSTNTDTPVVDFRLMNKKRRAKNPVFIDVEVWGKQAEVLYDRAANKSHVFINGELRQDNWQARDGGNRSKIKITASEIVVLKGKDALPVAEENEVSIDNF